LFTEIYIEALLADECLADQVRELWDVEEINDVIATIAWSFIAVMQAPKLIMGFVAIHTP
jgi:hypothetical protein